jgi:hypothetical protein
MKNFVLILFIVGVIGCNDSDPSPDNACPTAATLDDFPWVSNLMESADAFCASCEHSVAIGKYNDQTVIFLTMTDPLCNSTFQGPLHDCSGTIVKYFSNSSEDQAEFQKVTIDSILYRCQ